MSGESGESGEEGYIAFPGGNGDGSLTTHIRSTLIMSSQKTLRREGLFAEYEARLPPEHRQLILEATTPTWLDIAIGLAHYRACDALDLGPNTIADLAQGVAMHARGTFLGVALQIVRGVGVTPLTVAAHAPLVWRRAWLGGAISHARISETELRIEVVGWPCSSIPYCRHALRGLLLGVTRLLSPRGSVFELPALVTRSSVAYRVTWT